MNTKKIIALISGLGGIVIGIAMALFAVLDRALPKPLLFVFAVFCFTNAIIIFQNLKRKK